MTGPDFAELPAAVAVARRGGWTGAFDVAVLTHDDRALRRRRLETVHEETFVLQLPPGTRVDEGDAFVLHDGRMIEVVAAEERLVEATGEALPLAAYILGSRHAPAQVEGTRLLVRPDADLVQLLGTLGLALRPVSEPFHPAEGGDDGHGHSHGGRSPTVISRSGRMPDLPDDPLPEGGPFGP